MHSVGIANPREEEGQLTRDYSLLAKLALEFLIYTNN